MDKALWKSGGDTLDKMGWYVVKWHDHTGTETIYNDELGCTVSAASFPFS